MIDVYQEVTDMIIEGLENNVIPWKCPWVNSGSGFMPTNASTNIKYNGINIIILWVAAMKLGYSDNRWLTFKQGKELGGKVRKGEKSTMCVFYKPQVKGKRDEDSKDNFYFLAKPFRVFNVEQFEDLTLKSEIDLSVKEQFSDDQLVAKLLDIANQYSKNVGMKFQQYGDKAFYSPNKDLLVIPEIENFLNLGGWVGTLTHELGHSTGHKSRLDRFNNNFNSFNQEYKDSYCEEEVLAEFFATICSAEYGIVSEYPNHFSYINSFLKNLKKDKKFIFKVSSKVQKAHEFFLDKCA